MTDTAAIDAGRRRGLQSRAAGLFRSATGSHGARQMLANSGWLLVDKLLRALLGLVIGAWVARHLGPTHFGTLAYVLAFVALFQPIASLSADAIVVRNLSQAPDSAPDLLGSALVLRIGLGMVCWLLAVVIAALTSRGEPTLVVLTALVGGVLVFQAADVVDVWFQSRSQSRRTVLGKLVAYAVSSGLKVALILGDAPLPAFAAVIGLEALASAVALWLAYGRLRTTGAWKFSRQVSAGLLREAWPFALSGFAIMVYMRIDQIMVKELLGANELGIYAVALPISQFWQVIPMTIATSVAPFLARLRVSDPAAYYRSVVIAFRAFFYLGVLTAFITYAVSGWLVPRLFGAPYMAAVRILDTHAVSNVFCFLGIAHGLWLVNERRFVVRLYGTLLAGLSTVAVNLLLLPRIGLIGASLTAILAQSIAAFFINALLDKPSFRLQLAAIAFRKV